MPIDAQKEEIFRKIAKLISIETSAKLSALLNKKAIISFLTMSESLIKGDKIESNKEKSFLYSVNIDEPELGPIYLFTDETQMIPMIELLQFKEYDKSQEEIPNNLQMIFSDCVQTTIVSLSKRLANISKEIKIKISEKKFLKLNPAEPDTLKALPGTSEPIGMEFKLNIEANEYIVQLTVNKALIDFLITNLDTIWETLNITEIEEEIYREYGVKLEIGSGSLIDASHDGDSSLTKIDQKRNLGILRDINMELIIELGRAEMSMKDVLRLTRGSAIELDRQCSEPVDIYVHNQLVARGEVLAIDENFGIKITHILGNLNLAKKLGTKELSMKS
jgi:flagellar motor switch protein FliN